MNALRRISSTTLTTAVAATLSGALAAVATLPIPARAADIDLFTSRSGEAAAPNVYIMIDNSANWNANIGGTTKRVMEHEALHAVFTDPDIAGESGSETNPIKIRLGLGVFAAGNSPKGGKVWSAVEDVTTTYQNEIASILYDDAGNENLPATNNAPYALSFNETFAYFAGAQPVSGTQDGDHDLDAVVSANDGTKSYKAPSAGTCGKNYVILIGNGEPDSGEDNDAEAKLDAHGGRLAGDPIDVDPDNFEANWSDEFARLMAGSDVLPEAVRGDFERNVRTYVIDVHNPSSPQANTKPFQAARSWLKSIAQWGDGLYFTASTADEIKAALQKILDELFAVNSVFAASTLPVSVNVRGTNLNQVYMGVFRPDATGRTRWQGNLKLYQLDVDPDTNTLFLADRNGDPAQSPSTGFIVNTAESFWTHASSYWDYDPRGTPESGSDLPDGEVVEKGGVHQQLRDEHGSTPTARPLLTFSGTCSSSDGCALEDFDSGHPAVTEAALGTVDATETQDLVDWMHGLNNVSDTNDPDTKTTAAIRPSVHGDVLHSRPAVINYGDIDADGVSDVLAYYGANDGVFHAIHGGKESTDGNELWGFVPPEFFGKLKALRDLADGKEYFADGGIGTYRLDVDDDGVIEPVDGDKVHIYISMRRGGRVVYALNVSDPANPKFLWKRDHTDTGFSELGQTWSHPDVSRIQYTDSVGDTVTRDVLVFAAGYDPNADDPGATGSRSMGRGIFVVDAMTGEPIWQAGPSPSGATVNHTVADMTYSIPSDVTVIDRDDNGFDDRVYVGDTGGQVWRADISGAPADWQVHKLASDGLAAGQPERKFLYPPDVVFKHEPGGDRYDAVLLGTGDREDPFETSVTNRFYMFKDDYHLTTTFGADYPFTEVDLYDATANLVQVGTETEQQTASNELANARGWYIDLVAGGTGTGEKVVSSAITLGGTVFFNTNEPPPETLSEDECTKSLGTARNYEFSFEDATATTENNNEAGMQTDDRYSEATGGGFPPSPVPVLVEIDGKMYEVVLSGTEAKAPPSTTMGRRNPVYWKNDIDG